MARGCILLEDSRPPGPTGEIRPQKICEPLSNRWQSPAPFSDLTKVEVHYRIDQTAHPKSSTLTLRKGKRRNDRNSLSSSYHRDLRVQIVHHENRLIHHSNSRQMPIYKLPQWNIRLESGDLLVF